MLVIQLCKTALVASIALFFTLVALGNVTDYESNWAFVQHVFSMDTTFADSTIRWRAITNPAVQTIGYWGIILAETVTAIGLWVGAIRLAVRIGKPSFATAKSIAIAAVTFGFLIYSVGFVAIGGEWFAMWQSETWNGQTKAFEFLTMISATLIILLLPEKAEH